MPLRFQSALGLAIAGSVGFHGVAFRWLVPRVGNLEVGVLDGRCKPVAPLGEAGVWGPPPSSTALCWTAVCLWGEPVSGLPTALMGVFPLVWCVAVTHPISGFNSGNCFTGSCTFSQFLEEGKLVLSVSPSLSFPFLLF